MDFDDSVYERRRKSLVRLMVKGGRNQKQLAARLGIQDVQITRWLKPRLDGTYLRRMREDTARGIEQRLGLEPGWMDRDHTAAAPLAADVREVQGVQVSEPVVYYRATTPKVDPSPWPFRGIAQSDVSALPADAIARIEGYIQSQLDLLGGTPSSWGGRRSTDSPKA